MSTPTTINEEYDIVIAGGGTAACVIASRLASADAKLRVLLLEAGPTTYNNPAHTHPLKFLSHHAPGSHTTRAHVSQPSAVLGDRTMTVLCGQCLGGGSSVNTLMYTRPSASDYDDWETVYQNPGWGSKDLIPLLRKIETFQVPSGGRLTAQMDRSRSHQGDFFTDIGEQFLQVARTFDPIRAQKPDDVDTNDLETINVYTRRVPARMYRHNMIYPLKDTRPNLHFLTGVHVKHITFDERPRNTPYCERNEASSHFSGSVRFSWYSGTFRNRRQGRLERVGVKQRINLPGVGENYQDHNILCIKYFAADEAQILDALFRDEEGEIDAAAAEFGKTRRRSRPTTRSTRPSSGVPVQPSEVAELGPEFQEYWNSHFVNAPDKPVLLIAVLTIVFGDPAVLPPCKYFTLGSYTEYPLARGHVHITHADDVSAPVDFVPGFFESSRPFPSNADVRPLTWVYKFMREIARRMPHFRGEPPMLHPKFAPGGPASVIAHADGPVPFDAPRIVYSEEDERALEEFARAEVTTAWHSLGTCAMKPREQGGVVDSKLKRLKHVWTALVIGEKAALIIAEELGIKGVA
ncbi:alcohol oxidase-like protein [Lactarius vividus]|nr:alcohol oxidase-like protein [Lactarius vividus]